MRAIFFAVLALAVFAAGPAETTRAQGYNETIQTILSRKSVRNYDISKNISPAQLDLLVRTGMAAPTAMDKRPWEFVIVTDRTRLDAMAGALDHGKMLLYAKAAIVVCGDINKALPGMAQEFWVQDCSAATENILLAAESMGLGAVWVGLYPFPENMSRVRGVLEIPENVMPLAAVSIGYPRGGEKPKDKYDPARIHKDRW